MCPSPVVAMLVIATPSRPVGGADDHKDHPYGAKRATALVPGTSLWTDY